MELEEALEELDVELEDVEELDEVVEGLPVPPHPKKAVVSSRTDSFSIVFIPLPFNDGVSSGAVKQHLRSGIKVVQEKIAIRSQ